MARTQMCQGSGRSFRAGPRSIRPTLDRSGVRPVSQAWTLRIHSKPYMTFFETVMARVTPASVRTRSAAPCCVALLSLVWPAQVAHDRLSVASAAPAGQNAIRRLPATFVDGLATRRRPPDLSIV